MQPKISCSLSVVVVADVSTCWNIKLHSIQVAIGIREALDVFLV
ncbi:hypothetical protein C3B55_00922 [Candidatus Pseudomonas adelgestsugas]|uniref:Uncharacterized protein n=1 Tax=Candidatus Pseudomonas adelgestsugas TaxID=1302376 RepID=A0ABX5R992_9PSED|nr:hypothetical protein C3B55_00922 [Candidatus Pseudomonas adelgestsugas]